jgi:hypothetical protein
VPVRHPLRRWGALPAARPRSIRRPQPQPVLATTPGGHDRSENDVARDYNISRFSVQQLPRRSEAEWQAAFKRRARRPRTNPGGSAGSSKTRSSDCARTFRRRAWTRAPRPVPHLAAPPVTDTSISGSASRSSTRRTAGPSSHSGTSRRGHDAHPFAGSAPPPDPGRFILRAPHPRAPPTLGPVTCPVNHPPAPTNADTEPRSAWI